MAVQGKRTLVLNRRADDHRVKMAKKLAERKVSPSRFARATAAVERELGE